MSTEVFQPNKSQSCKEIVEDLPKEVQVVTQPMLMQETPKPSVEEQTPEDSDSSDVHIIPWKSKLRKVNCPK